MRILLLTLLLVPVLVRRYLAPAAYYPLKLILDVWQAGLQALQQNSSSDAADALSVCPLPFAPSVCLNKAIQELKPFPSPERMAYMVTCHYQNLSLQDDQARQCLVVAASVQATHPRYGLLLLLPHGARIETGYYNVMLRANIQAVRQAHHLKVPQAGIDWHRERWQGAWLTAYQKLYAWSLSAAFSKLLLIDSDSVVLENIDHVFSLPGSAIGADCTPHAWLGPERWVRAHGCCTLASCRCSHTHARAADLQGLQWPAPCRAECRRVRQDPSLAS